MEVFVFEIVSGINEGLGMQQQPGLYPYVYAIPRWRPDSLKLGLGTRISVWAPSRAGRGSEDAAPKMPRLRLPMLYRSRHGVGSKGAKVQKEFIRCKSSKSSAVGLGGRAAACATAFFKPGSSCASKAYRRRKSRVDPQSSILFAIV